MKQKSGNTKRFFSMLLILALCITSIAVIPTSTVKAADTSYKDMVNVNSSMYDENDHDEQPDIGDIGTTPIIGHDYVKALFGTASWANPNPYVFSNGDTAHIYLAAFDDSSGSYFDGRTDGICGVEFEHFQYITRIGYSARQSVDRLNGAFFEGSEDGTAYDLLYTLDDCITPGEMVYKTIGDGLKADKAYKYFRVRGTGLTGKELNPFDIKLYTYDTAGNGDDVLNELPIPSTIYSDKLDLPSSIAGLDVTWVSNTPNVMDNSGNVVTASRPATAKLTATLQWNVGRTYTQEFTVKIESQTPVVNAAGAASVVYNGRTITLSSVTDLFTLGAGAGKATYSLEGSSEATGVGDLNAETGVLTVTKAGVFKIGLVTAATESHEAGDKVIATLTVAKGTASAPAAPTLPSYNDPEDDPVGTESITLREVAGMEYGIGTDTGIAWQDSATFDNLNTGTEYTFYQRKKETDLYNASAASNPLTVATYKIPVTNKAGAATVTYNNATIDLSGVSGLFTVDPQAGQRTYSIESEGTTGAGIIAAGTTKLTVTRDGVFKIGLVTADTATHQAGEKVIATLTVKANTYTVTYNKNGATKGSVPADATKYTANSQATVKGKGSLVRNGYTFAGWTLNAKGTGKVYKANEKISITNASVTLYAKWNINAKKPTIKKQPKAKSVNQGTKYTLSVNASVKAIKKGSSKLSYQWYSNTKNNTKGGKKIKKATKKNFVVPTNKKGTLYYYCIITNTDSKATGAKKAAVTSKRAKIKVN